MFGRHLFILIFSCLFTIFKLFVYNFRNKWMPLKHILALLTWGQKCIFQRHSHLFQQILIWITLYFDCTYKVSGFKYANVPFWDGLRIVGSSAFSRKIITGSSMWEFCWFWSLVELQLQQFWKNLDSWKFAIILYFLVMKTRKY